MFVMVPNINKNWIEYRLDAEKDGESASEIVDVSLVEYHSARMLRYLSPDNLAVINAAGTIMAKAHDNNIWARGKITLTSPDGRVIETMEAKL